MESIDTYSSTATEKTGQEVFARVWIPDVSPKPIKGSVFISLDSAYDFYRTYARKSGFECKRGGDYNPHGKGKDPNLKYFHCSREGFKPKSKVKICKVQSGNVSEKENDDPRKIIKRKRPSIRCGCKAQVRLKRRKDNMYEVYVFVEEHNHGFVEEKDQKFLKAYRELTYTKKQFLYQVSTVNYGPVKGFKIMKELYGGFENIGATAVDCKNFRREINLFIGDRDAQMLIDKLKSKQTFFPGYFMDYETDETNSLCRVFWADVDSKRNYATFGDIVSFDATFRSNKYKMVFIPFTGIDNHNRCVTFGGGLLSKETIKSYEWLLQRFKTAFGKDPKVLVTDQDPAIKQAIPAVFPNTRHRLCMWHIMQKFTKKVGPTMCSNSTFRKRICDIVWDEKISTDAFEKEWVSIMKEFNLEGNKWLSDIFDLKSYWIPAYYRDEPMSGLMRTTSRSESENHFFGQLTSTDLTLVEFLSHFETAVDSQRFMHDKNDHDSRYTLPDFRTSLPIEKHAAAKYTRSIFFDVQVEIYASLMSCHSISRENIDGCTRYLILDVSKSYSKKTIEDGCVNLDEGYDHEGNIKNGVFQVLLNLSDETYVCSCKHFECYGLLCRHMFYVFRMCKINHIPEKYLLKRWLKDALPAISVNEKIGFKECGNNNKDVELLIRDIHRSVEDSVNRLVNDISKLRLYQDKQKELLESIVAEIPIPPIVNKKDMMCSLLGVVEPDAANMVNVPKGIRNKGCGSKKRMISKSEIAISQSERKFRECKTCFKMVNDHDSRNCTSKSENQAAVQAPQFVPEQ